MRRTSSNGRSMPTSRRARPNAPRRFSGEWLSNANAWERERSAVSACGTRDGCITVSTSTLADARARSTSRATRSRIASASRWPNGADAAHGPFCGPEHRSVRLLARLALPVGHGGEDGVAADAVGDGMVELEEERRPAVAQSLVQPRLPERPRAVERRLVGRRDLAEELVAVVRRRPARGGADDSRGRTSDRSPSAAASGRAARRRRAAAGAERRAPPARPHVAAGPTRARGPGRAASPWWSAASANRPTRR